MQDVTNLPFMRVIQRYGGPDYYVTEYFRVHADYLISKKILRSITENATGRPVYAQLIGQDIAALIRVAKELQEYPIAGIDLNLGCPAPVVCKKEAGGGLLRNPLKISQILSALRDACGESRFTVKTRIGYDSPTEFEDIMRVFKSIRSLRTAFANSTSISTSRERDGVSSAIAGSNSSAPIARVPK